MSVAADYWPEFSAKPSLRQMVERAATVAGLTERDLNCPDQIGDVTATGRMVVDCGLPVSGHAMRYYSNRVSKRGAFTNPDPAVRHEAFDLTKRGIDAVRAMGAPMMTLWLGQDGYDYAFQCDYGAVWEAGVSGIAEVAAHDQDCLITIEYKPNEPWSCTILPDAAGTRVGGVSRTVTNEYWRSLGQGFQNIADKPGLEFVYQAAANEGDQLGQVSIDENLIGQRSASLLLSPQTAANLIPAVEAAKAAGVAILNVNDAVTPSAEHYVGNVKKGNGVNVANWFIANRPDGGKGAVIGGQPGVYAAGQRTAGFIETSTAAAKFEVVASVPANWSREEAFNAATTIPQQYPNLIGFYANNDGIIRHRPVTVNIGLPAMGQFSRAGLMLKAKLKARSGGQMTEVRLRPFDVSSLSGRFPAALRKKPSSGAGWRQTRGSSCLMSRRGALMSVARSRFKT